LVLGMVLHSWYVDTPESSAELTTTARRQVYVVKERLEGVQGPHSLNRVLGTVVKSFENAAEQLEHELRVHYEDAHQTQLAGIMTQYQADLDRRVAAVFGVLEPSVSTSRNTTSGGLMLLRPLAMRPAGTVVGDVVQLRVPGSNSTLVPEINTPLLDRTHFDQYEIISGHLLNSELAQMGASLPDVRFTDLSQFAENVPQAAIAHKIQKWIDSGYSTWGGDYDSVALRMNLLPSSKRRKVDETPLDKTVEPYAYTTVPADYISHTTELKTLVTQIVSTLFARKTACAPTNAVGIVTDAVTTQDTFDDIDTRGQFMRARRAKYTELGVHFANTSEDKPGFYTDFISSKAFETFANKDPWQCVAGTPTMLEAACSSDIWRGDRQNVSELVKILSDDQPFGETDPAVVQEIMDQIGFPQDGILCIQSKHVRDRHPEQLPCITFSEDTLFVGGHVAPLLTATACVARFLDSVDTVCVESEVEHASTRFKLQTPPRFTGLDSKVAARLWKHSDTSTRPNLQRVGFAWDDDAEAWVQGGLPLAVSSTSTERLQLPFSTLCAGRFRQAAEAVRLVRCEQLNEQYTSLEFSDSVLEYSVLREVVVLERIGPHTNIDTATLKIVDRDPVNPNKLVVECRDATRDAISASCQQWLIKPCSDPPATVTKDGNQPAFDNTVVATRYMCVVQGDAETQLLRYVVDNFAGWHFGNSDRHTVHAILAGPLHESLRNQLRGDTDYYWQSDEPHFVAFLHTLANAIGRSGTSDERVPLAVPATVLVKGPKTVGTLCYTRQIMKVTPTYHSIDAKLWLSMTYIIRDMRNKRPLSGKCLVNDPRVVTAFRIGGDLPGGSIIRVLYERHHTNVASLAHVARLLMLMNIIDCVSEDAGAKYRNGAGLYANSNEVQNMIQALLYSM
jgi:hypothetical protein